MKEEVKMVFDRVKEIIVDDEAKAILEIDLGKIMDEIKKISQV